MFGSLLSTNTAVGLGEFGPNFKGGGKTRERRGREKKERKNKRERKKERKKKERERKRDGEEGKTRK